jgi:aminoglycoside 6-adenylyltransferase
MTGLLALRERVIAWVASAEWIEAAALFGATERRDRPADEWSDLDVLLVVPDPTEVVEDGAWPLEIGPAWISLVHDAPLPGIRVRQVLYEPGHDVDWVPVSWSDVDALSSDELAEVFGHGLRILRDPQGRLARALHAVGSNAGPSLPSEASFAWVVDDFLYQVVWAVKRLRRGELWRAKDDVDGYLKRHLLTMLTWHALARDPATTVFPEGRRLDAWVDPVAVARLPDTFARWDPQDIGRAILATLDLFADLARVVGTAARSRYPEERHATVRAWAVARLVEGELA